MWQNGHVEYQVTPTAVAPSFVHLAVLADRTHQTVLRPDTQRELSPLFQLSGVLEAVLLSTAIGTNGKEKSGEIIAERLVRVSGDGCVRPPSRVRPTGWNG